MLFCITNKCSMGCPHCMSDCKPEGQLLDKNDLMPFINFFNFMRFRTLLISSGEPTEHPDFSYIVETIVEKMQASGYGYNLERFFCRGREKIE